MLNFEKKQNPRFEIEIQVRDNQGLPTGKTKIFTTNNSEDLESIWNTNTTPRRKKKKVAEVAKSEKEIAVALKEVETHYEKIKKKRKLEE